jgi:hypothetical protein
MKLLQPCKRQVQTGPVPLQAGQDLEVLFEPVAGAADLSANECNRACQWVFSIVSKLDSMKFS